VLSDALPIVTRAIPAAAEHHETLQRCKGCRQIVKPTHRKGGKEVVTINQEMREGPNGEPEVWANLGDILDWLDTLPALSNDRIAAAVAMEIRERLFESVKNAQLITKSE
jgi:hypothetical protein